MSAGTVGTLLSGLRPGPRRLGIGGLALALLTVVLPAFADTPQTGTDPSVTLSVSPSAGLADGQIVTVTGTGFASSTVGTIRQCGGTATAPQCDVTNTTPFVTTAAGTIPPTAFPVKRIVDTGATTFNCGVQACVLMATAGVKSSQHEIRMAGAGTVPTPSSTTTSSTTSSSTSSTVAPTTTSSSTTSPSTTSSSTTSSSTTSSSTTSTVPGTSTSTTSPVPTGVVPSTSCAGLRFTQADAIAGIDSLIAAFPQFSAVGVQAREATNSKFAQMLANAGC